MVQTDLDDDADMEYDADDPDDQDEEQDALDKLGRDELLAKCKADKDRRRARRLRLATGKVAGHKGKKS